MEEKGLNKKTMLKSNEIRIGNYVLANNKVETIYGISEDYPFLDTTEYGFGAIDWRDIKPIELTEDWFVRFGFKKVNEYYHIPCLDIDYCFKYADFRDDYGFYIQYTDSPFAEDDGKYYPVSFRIKYVHQLQNLYFALVGEELKLINKD